MSRFQLAAGFALVLGAAHLATPAPASAYQCLTGSCPKWCDLPVPYAITVTSADLDEATCLTETRRGMDDWTGLSCTNLTMVYNGRSSGTAGRGDGQHLIGWLESGWPHGSSAIGVTTPRWNGRNCLIEADMQMNGQNFTWITGSGSGSNVNTYSIALHEGGHYIGLGHSSASGNPIMYFAYRGGIGAIGADDQMGICTLYPGSGGGSTDCRDVGVDCPAGQTCDTTNGNCVGGDTPPPPTPGEGGVCDPCPSGNGDCESGGFCLAYFMGAPGVCGTACTSDSDCTEDTRDRCINVSGMGQCVRFNGDTPDCSGAPTPPPDPPDPDCVNDTDCMPGFRCASGSCVEEMTTPELGELGDPCADSTECRSNLCAPGRNVCTRSCDWLNTTSCPDSFFCDGDATGACGSGLCFAGTRGAATNGQSCTGDTDCTSLYCGGGICGMPCAPGPDAECASGQTCQATGGSTTCGICADGAELGEWCDDNADCLSGICAVQGGSNWCTEFCSGDCPDGFECQAVGDGDLSVCAPNDGPPPPPPGTTPPGSSLEGGCGCVVPGSTDTAPKPWILLIVIPAIVWWRRRRR